MLATPKPPKGYDMIRFPTRGGQSANIYSQLSELFPELINQAKGAPGAFDAMEGQAMRQFNQQVAPNIAQRYAGSGIGSSSGMQNSLAAAGRDLTENLAARRQQLMQQSMQNVLGLGNILLSNPDEMNFLTPKGPKWWQQILGLGSPVAGAGIGGLLGGGIGSLLGFQGGTGFGQGFLGLR